MRIWYEFVECECCWVGDDVWCVIVIFVMFGVIGIDEQVYVIVEIEQDLVGNCIEVLVGIFVFGVWIVESLDVLEIVVLVCCSVDMCGNQVIEVISCRFRESLVIGVVFDVGCFDIGVGFKFGMCGCDVDDIGRCVCIEQCILWVVQDFDVFKFIEIIEVDVVVCMWYIVDDDIYGVFQIWVVIYGIDIVDMGCGDEFVGC